MRILAAAPRPGDRAPGRGLAAAALVLILLITAGWWALALYPVGDAAPDWVMRTRAACFGSVGSGLPSAGGWVLLVGEPIGMIATLAAVWGRALRGDVRWLAARATGRVALGAVVVATLTGGGFAAVRVRAARAGATAFDASASVAPLALLDGAAPPLGLVDQHGQRITTAMLRGAPAIVTFAFAHCADVCPTLVQQLRQSRADAGRSEVPLVVVTLDPWRDTPARLPHIARQWELTGPDRVLSGDVEEVSDVLDAWRVGRSRDTRTGDVGHGAVAYLMDADGNLRARLDGGIDRIRALLAATR